MKKIIVLFFIVGCFSRLDAQVQLGENTNCDSPYQVCNETWNASIDITSSSDCDGNTMDLWFSVDVVSSDFHLYFQSLEPIAYAYVYGPFSGEPGCSNLGGAIITNDPPIHHDFSLRDEIFPSTPSLGRYIIQIGYDTCVIDLDIIELYGIDCVSEPNCIDNPECVVFQPDVGKRYWLSAWVKEDHPYQVLDYTSYVELTFVGSIAVMTFSPSGEIIDGWQRIVGDFTIPQGVTDLQIDLVNASGVDAYFDDIRVHPWNAGMKSYVYDPETFWLVAELDDNNYATFYEYDKEGGLVRIKKETSRGVMTIQETRSYTQTGLD